MIADCVITPFKYICIFNLCIITTLYLWKMLPSWCLSSPMSSMVEISADQVCDTL